MLAGGGVALAVPAARNETAIRNEVLDRLCASDWALVGPCLEAVRLDERQVIETPGKPITYAYFLDTGLASVVAANAEGHRIEVGVIGKEGMTGLPLVMGDDRAPALVHMQIAGSGHRIAADDLVQIMHASAGLSALLIKAAHAFMIQTAHTALANGRARLAARLARRLLMAHDRLDGDTVPMTHEFLATMLGVRRAGVTVALHDFARRGLIAMRRGQVTLIDQDALAEVAAGFYGVPEAERRRLMADML